MNGLPENRLIISDIVFKIILFLSAFVVILLPVLLFFMLLNHSFTSLQTFGLKFLWGTKWNPVLGKFGAFPFITGTLMTSFIALFISLPFSLCISILLGEYFTKGILSKFLSSSIELLAGIPSVIYGFWGLLVLVPVIRKIELQLDIAPYGVGIFTAALILTIMIIPYSVSLGRGVIQLVPQDLKEAAYSLGATRFEVIKKVVIPHARSGILAGILLSLGRALGETMAVTMVIGNANIMPKGIFTPGNTMASIIANEFTEAVDPLYLSSLIELGLLLFIITAVINFGGQKIVKRLSYNSVMRKNIHRTVKGS
jgi:phosphate transport system permease protein